MTVTARRLSEARIWRTRMGSELTAQRGDWVLSDGETIWTVAADVFAATYRPVDDGIYTKSAIVTARQLDSPYSFATLEGEADAAAGDWLVRNPSGEVWPVSPGEFERRYRRASP